MNIRLSVFGPLAVLVIASLMLVSCSKSTTNAEPETTAGSTTPSTTTPSSTSSDVAGMSQTLMDQLGGMTGVTKLADAFAANLSANPTVSTALTPDAINSAKQGLVNEIAKVSGAPEPYAGASLLGALSGKGLTSDGVKGVEDALASAADTMNLSSPAKESLKSIMSPVSKALQG
jgi:truncated hemoglobin YjbI